MLPYMQHKDKEKVHQECKEERNEVHKTISREFNGLTKCTLNLEQH